MEFVVVRNVVEEVERKILPNFGEHRRLPELFAVEKMFLVENIMRSLLD